MTENNAPTQYLPERLLSLISLAEEASEVAIECSKAIRFGPHGVCGVGENKGTTPLQRLAGEIGDFLGCVTFLIEQFPELELEVVRARATRKPDRIRHFNNPENW